MSKFGKGLSYCIGLFLSHSERKIYNKDYSLWFNGASDHLYDLQIPDIEDNLQKRISHFRDEVLNCGDGERKWSAKKKDFEWAIREAKDILMELDKLFDIDVEKGDYE